MGEQSKFNPEKEQLHFAREAVDKRTEFYEGRDDAIARHGEVLGPEAWASDKRSERLANANKWNMQQADMFGSIAQTAYMRMLVTEVRVQSQLLLDIKNLLTEIRDRGDGTT